jgi:ABC-type antimicrobial peptide transport system permease subunit
MARNLKYKHNKKHHIMIQSYLKIARRNLVKNKVHSLINIVGLSVGMAVAMLIGLWIWDEVSFDKQYKNHGRIAQVWQNVTNNGEVQTWGAVPYPLAAELRKYSDFKYVVLAAGMGDHIVALGDKQLKRNGGYMETQGPDMLNLQMLKGKKEALKDPSSILISASTAKAYFGDADPIDKTLKIDNQINAKVAGVYADQPRNSSFADWGFIGPWEMYYANTGWVRTAQEPWRPNAFIIFTQLADHADMATVSQKIKDVKLRHVNAMLAKKKPALFLFPMNKWHLYSDFKDGKNIGGRIQYVWLFGIIGVFVLLLACINFMNLSTARSEKRAREVGIRKAIGSVRSQLIYQFFSESLLYVMIAFVLAILLVQLSLPFFNQVADKQMGILWGNPQFWIFSIGFSLITGLIAGSYPAFYLSSFRPVKVLKGSFRVGKLASVPRKVLVVVQFTVSITLVIGTIVVFKQIQFAKSRPIGYDNNGLVSVPVIGHEIHSHYDVVKAELLKTGAVVKMAEAGGSPTTANGSTSGIEWKGKDPNMGVDFQKTASSYDYGKTVGWQFKDGRDFSSSFLTDSVGLVVNEAAVKFMGLKNPVGETITWDGQPFKIIGVINDMITQSPYGKISPSLFFLDNGPGSAVLLKINPRISATEAISKIEAVFKQYNPSQLFEYRFVDQEYAKKFGNEQRVGKLAAFFASLAIFISCLGLFGMAAFMAEQRIKEIGVRKVLGASVFNLWKLLSTDFIGLVAISLIIATPVAWYLMHNWLQSYEYRSTISGWIFMFTGLGAISITLLTVSYQSVKAALANPIKSLKTE